MRIDGDARLRPLDAGFLELEFLDVRYAPRCDQDTAGPQLARFAPFARLQRGDDLVVVLPNGTSRALPAAARAADPAPITIRSNSSALMALLSWV
jgi:hypothetical protein